MARITVFVCTAAVGLPALWACGQWAVFEEDPSRLDAPAALGAADTAEKDYAWGDVDHDGDIDLVVVRKQPWTTTGRRPNVLFMNEGIAEGHAVDGVLVDRTGQYASASNIVGDLGFLTPTNDRDVVLVDVNGDTWLDIVTSTTLSGLTAPKSISHPRIYINQGLDAGGNWLGFVYDDVDRVPTMATEPRFCGVAAGDPEPETVEELRRLLTQARPAKACDEVDWTLFGVSMATYNVAASLALAVGSLWGAEKIRRQA